MILTALLLKQAFAKSLNSLAAKTSTNQKILLCKNHERRGLGNLKLSLVRKIINALK